MQLVSMAKTVEEKRDESRPWSEGPDPAKIEDYPYGLTINLSTAELRKLGFARGQLDPGARVNIVAVAMVKSARAEVINGLETHEATLQIEQMAMEPLSTDDPNETRAASMFGEKK